MELLREASEAGLSFHFVNGELRLFGKAPSPELLSRLRADRLAILAHFEHVQARQIREQFVSAVQTVWPGARVVDERLYIGAEDP